MTQVHESAYIAALEKKLMEAERALYGFRAIWNNLQSHQGYMGEIESGSGTERQVLDSVHGEGDPPDTCAYPQEPECIE